MLRPKITKLKNKKTLQPLFNLMKISNIAKTNLVKHK